MYFALILLSLLLDVAYAHISYIHFSYRRLNSTCNSLLKKSLGCGCMQYFYPASFTSANSEVRIQFSQAPSSPSKGYTRAACL